MTVGALAITVILIVSQASAEIISDFSDVPTTKPNASAVYKLADRNIRNPRILPRAWTSCRNGR